MEEDLYKQLGVERDATSEEIEKAYRDRAMILHPDHGGSIEQFRQLTHAKKVLTDAESRAKYDETNESVKPSEVEETLRELVKGAFASVPGPQDPIKWMLETVDQARAKAEMQRDQLPGKISRLEAKFAKFQRANVRTKNTAGRQLIVAAFEHEIAALYRAKQVAEKNIRIGTAVLTVLNDIQYPREGFANQFADAFAYGRARATWGP